MSDAKLRELERAWQATGRPQDEAAYLVESIRVGRLTQDELELAAWAHHPAALHALGGPLPGPSPDELSRWVAGLARWGRPLCVRAALEAIHQVILGRGLGIQEIHDLNVDPVRTWCEASDLRPAEHAARLEWLAGRPLRAGVSAGSQLAVAVVLAARAALQEDFAHHAANAVVRCEAVLGEGECKRPLVALVVARALRRPEPPLPRASS